MLCNAAQQDLRERRPTAQYPVIRPDAAEMHTCDIRQRPDWIQQLRQQGGRSFGGTLILMREIELSTGSPRATAGFAGRQLYG